MKSPFRFLMFMLAAAGVLSFGTSADAALTLTLQDGVNPDFVVVDNSPDDENPNVGVITTFHATNGVNFNQVTGFGFSALGEPELDINAAHIGSTGGTLTIILTRDNLTLPAVPGAILSSDIGGTIEDDGDVSFVAQLDVNNDLPYADGPTTSTGPLTPFMGTVFGGADSEFFNYNGGLFSLTAIITVNFGAGESISYNALTEVTPLPEPATLAYLGLGLGALGLRRRRRSA